MHSLALVLVLAGAAAGTTYALQPAVHLGVQCATSPHAIARGRPGLRAQFAGSCLPQGSSAQGACFLPGGGLTGGAGGAPGPGRRSIRPGGSGLQCRASGEGGGGGGPVRYTGPGYRVVKCFPELARRQADQAVQDGRVTVNGERAQPALRLRGGDVLHLDGKRVEWEPLAVAGEQGGERMVYFKYHKPLDVASSWDKNDRSSMLHFMPPDLLTRKGGGEGQPIPGRIPTKNLMLQRQQQQMGAYRGKRLFPVGRLDKDSSGLMLVTNDGRLVNALLQPRASKDKEYLVEVDRRSSPARLFVCLRAS